METPSLNFVDSSFEQVLHSYGLHVVSTYKYEIGNCIFYSISYLLKNHLSFLELRQNNMAYILYVYKAHSCSISTFLNNPQIIIQKFPEHCPIIIMRDFDVDILKDNKQPKNKQELFISWINSN